MARTGQFSGSTFLFGAPLLSVHPIDNRFPDLKKDEDEDDEVQPVDRTGEPAQQDE